MSTMEQRSKFPALANTVGNIGAPGRGATPNQYGRKPTSTQSTRIFPTSTPMMGKKSEVKMSSDRIENFKLGFLSKIAETGMTPSEFFTKIAFLDPEKILDKLTGKAMDAGFSLGGSALDLGTSALKGLGAVAVGAPIALGGAAGAAKELLEQTTPEDIELLRKMEELGVYRRLTSEIKNRMAMRGAQ
jgi:hypothetical protein